jgi:hypothetical protein
MINRAPAIEKSLRQVDFDDGYSLIGMRIINFAVNFDG